VQAIGAFSTFAIARWRSTSFELQGPPCTAITRVTDSLKIGRVRMRNHLFTSFDLDDQLRRKQSEITALVDSIPEPQFLVSSDDDIVANLVAKQRVEPLELLEDQARMDMTETQVDVSGDPRRHFSRDRSGPFYIPGTEVVVRIPFVGDPGLFEARTNPWSSMCPFGIVQTGHDGVSTLEIRIARPHDADQNLFKQQYDANLTIIREYLQRSRAQVDAYNAQLELPVRRAVAARRQRLEKHKGIADLLNIPLQARAGAPSIEPIRLETKNPPPLPVPPRTGLRPEPGITDADYERILKIIRHEGLSFETTPATFAKHGEEGLRDIILAHLNGHFEGGATGETFRRKGKTDIRIEDGERSAFVAECKVWRGAAEITGALDQLLSYLTWRDSKAALIVFNTKVGGFLRTSHAIDKIAHRTPELYLGGQGGARGRIQSRDAEHRG
jgi:hypothetical protein